MIIDNIFYEVQTNTVVIYITVRVYPNNVITHDISIQY